MSKNPDVKFIRVRGRIVPVKRKGPTTGDKIAGAAIGGLGAANVATGAYLANKGAGKIAQGLEAAKKQFHFAVGAANHMRKAKDPITSAIYGGLYREGKYGARRGIALAKRGGRQLAIGTAGMAVGALGLVVGRSLWKGKKK